MSPTYLFVHSNLFILAVAGNSECPEVTFSAARLLIIIIIIIIISNRDTVTLFLF